MTAPKISNYIPGLGMWRLVCEDEDEALKSRETEADKIWKSLCNIHEDAPELFPKPPKKNVKSSIGTSACINCYTSNYTDVAGIRRAAEFIRKRVGFPFLIYYYSCDSPTKSPLLFQHTPELELYQETEHGRKLVSNNPSTNITPSWADDNNVPSSRPPPNGVPLPSEVFDQQDLYMPSTEEGIRNMKREIGGKWLVYSPGNNGLAIHDRRWTALLSLYQTGILVGLKASTNVLLPPDVSNVQRFQKKDPVILCYTADADNIEDVLKTAVAIRNVVSSDYAMYYKENRASMKGAYYREGKKSVSKYQHTVGGGLYQRDHLTRLESIVPGKVW